MDNAYLHVLYLHTHLHARVQIHMRVPIWIHGVHSCTHVRVDAYTYIDTDADTCDSCTHENIYARKPTHTHALICRRACTHTHTRVQVHKHIHARALLWEVFAFHLLSLLAPVRYLLMDYASNIVTCMSTATCVIIEAWICSISRVSF